MNIPPDSGFVRVKVGLAAGATGALVGLVSQAIWCYRDGYVGTPSVMWAIAGAAVGLAFGTYWGSKPLTGRSAWIVSGLVAGIAGGSLFGSFWARSEFSLDRHRLQSYGVPADYLDDSMHGLFAGDYDAIGLRYGACLGIVAGVTCGLCWKRDLRSRFFSRVTIAAAVCAATAAVFLMQSQFSHLSKQNLSHLRSSWDYEREMWTRLRGPERQLHGEDWAKP